MLPFLCVDKIVKALADQFVKHKIMAPVSSTNQLLKLMCFWNHKVYAKVISGNKEFEKCYGSEDKEEKCLQIYVLDTIA